jgi:hypothetical protein
MTGARQLVAHPDRPQVSTGRCLPRHRYGIDHEGTRRVPHAGDLEREDGGMMVPLPAV